MELLSQLYYPFVWIWSAVFLILGLATLWNIITDDGDPRKQFRKRLFYMWMVVIFLWGLLPVTLGGILLEPYL